MAKLPIYEKELEKNLELGVVGHTFNLSTRKAEGDRSLSLRAIWSAEKVSAQPGHETTESW